MIAFLTWAGEKLGPERRWLHQGMTSSDVLDTALAVQLKQAADLLIGDIDALLACSSAARSSTSSPDHRPQPRHPCRADHLRSQARPGPRRVRAQPRAAGPARDEVATCAISGAVGTFANVPPAVEEHVAAELGLTRSRPPRRSSRATATRCFSRRSA